MEYRSLLARKFDLIGLVLWGREKWTRGGPYKLLAGDRVDWRNSSGVGARLLPGRRGTLWCLHEVVWGWWLTDRENPEKIGRDSEEKFEEKRS
ncbi:hypothetical protein MTP99_007587 [Tenebrio molitor]|nr:hypothetical protein MTP99_007587 [Tenebrio molitor]